MDGSLVEMDIEKPFDSLDHEFLILIRSKPEIEGMTIFDYN